MWNAQTNELPLTPHETLLSELHGGMAPYAEKDTLLIVEGQGEQRASIRDIMGIIFPNYKIEAVRNSPEEIAQISDKLRDNVAMIVDVSSSEEQECALVHSDKGVDLNLVPIVSQPSVPSDERENVRSALLVAEGKVDGAIENPVKLEDLGDALNEAINKRLEVKGKIDEIARSAVLADYFAYIDAAVAEWSSKMSKVFSTNPEIQEEIDMIKFGITRMRKLLDILGGKNGIITPENLSEFVHSSNNVLTTTIGYSHYLCCEGGIEDQSAEFFEELEKSMRAFCGYTALIQNAYKGTNFMSWMYVDPSKLDDLSDPQKLELPKDMNVCVVDDCSEVLQYCSKAIPRAGGNYFEAGNKDALSGIHKFFGEDGIDLFLLDNNLGTGPDGETVTGDQLISQIQSDFPNALIIAHTGDSESLKADPDNPYSLKGVEIVGKHQWNEVTRILREKRILID